MSVKAVFLDRDGVINAAIERGGKPYPPATPAEVVIPADVPAALEKLRRRGFQLVVVTNQPDVARGKTTQAEVIAIHTHLKQQLPLDIFRVCYHDDGDSCTCRKPMPGMLLAVAKEFDIDLTASFMVGDRWRDVEAGQRAGCRTAWIDQGWQEKQPNNADFTATSLIEVADWICQQA